MIKRKTQINVKTMDNQKGEAKLFLSDLADFVGMNEKVKLFSHAKLKAGEGVDYHIHTGEFEIYYILSGKALYNDNGEEIQIYPQTVTFTPSGKGHGIKNIGSEPLEFIALIVKD